MCVCNRSFLKLSLADTPTLTIFRFSARRHSHRLSSRRPFRSAIRLYGYLPIYLLDDNPPSNARPPLSCSDCNHDAPLGVVQFCPTCIQVCQPPPCRLTINILRSFCPLSSPLDLHLLLPLSLPFNFSSHLPTSLSLSIPSLVSYYISPSHWCTTPSVVRFQPWCQAPTGLWR